MDGDDAKYWREAVDPKTNRTYYYDKRTRETQWRKPLCLASPEERQAMIDKEKQQKDFFAEMEANIINNLKKGVGVADVDITRESESDDSLPELMGLMTRMTSASEPPMPSTRMVRTISSMDDLMIAELQKDENKKKNSSNSAGKSGSGRSVEEGQSEVDVNELKALTDSMRSMSPDFLRNISSGSNGSSIPENGSVDFLTNGGGDTIPRLMHRNSGGTIYVGTTMSAPDKDATIRCVCGVFRAHMVQATTGVFSEDELFEEYEIFNDKEFRGVSAEEKAAALERGKSDVVPSLDKLHNFYRSIFTKSQMETDCIIMSLIYVERLLKTTKGGIRLRTTNYKSVIFR